MKFYLQSGYDGRETATIALTYDRDQIFYSKVYPYNGETPVGSVEFCESLLGWSPRPVYFPEFLGNFIKRKVWYSDTHPEDGIWIKPALRHKQWEAYESGTKAPESGPYWCSELVEFKEEWRYYVRCGKVLAAHWYLGEEKEIAAPPLKIDWGNFSGAVDFGRDVNGEIQLVESNMPYACGWYGPFEDGKIFGEWLTGGWCYMGILKYRALLYK